MFYLDWHAYCLEEKGVTTAAPQESNKIKDLQQAKNKTHKFRSV